LVDLSLDLVEAIAEGRTVLVPGNRTARAVRLRYADHARARGHSGWRTPDVLATGAWLERTFLQIRGRQALPRLLGAAHAAALWDAIVARSEAGLRLINAASAARSAASAWALAQAWGIDLARVAADPGDEAQAFTAWVRAFEADCVRQNWIARPRLARYLAQRGRALGVRLYVPDPAELRPDERGLLATLSERGDDVVFGAPRNRAPLAPAPCVVAARDPTDELMRAADWARAQVAAGATAVGVVVTELHRRLGAVERAFADAFAPGTRLVGSAEHLYGVEIAAARPLDEYPLVRAALDVLALVGGRVASPIAGAILRSPFLAGADSEAAARALADVRLRRDGREHFDAVVLERQALANRCDVLAECLQALVSLPHARTHRAPPSVWGEHFLAVWRTLGWPGPRGLTSDERQTIEKLRESLAIFGSLDEVLPALTFDAARAEFARLAATTSFEPRAVGGVVTIIDPQTVVGIEFDALWLAGMTATDWPPPPDPDPFVPIALQVHAGVPQATAAGMQREARRRFDRLVASADRVVASWYRSDGDAEERPSPWIAEWPRGDESQPRGHGYRQTLLAARPVLERVADAASPAVAGEYARGGARIAELQSLCPFRAQAELRLGAHPMAVVAPGVGPLVRGQLAHRVLDDVWRELRSQARLAARTDAALTDEIRAIVARRAQALLAGASGHHVRLVAIESELAQARVLELLRIERMRSPFAVYDRPERSESVRIGGIVIDLRIDRIDELEDGSLVIVDYKTGSSADTNAWYGDRPRQPQMPLYAVVHRDRVAAVAFALLSSARVGFAGTARSAGLLPGVEASMAESRASAADSWDAVLEGWQHAVERLLSGFAAGGSAVDPLPGACRYCHLRILCRIDERAPEAAMVEDDGG
jgi:ATP-dependent helicase/nuclease subunit B